MAKSTLVQYDQFGINVLEEEGQRVSTDPDGQPVLDGNDQPVFEDTKHLVILLTAGSETYRFVAAQEVKQDIVSLFYNTLSSSQKKKLTASRTSTPARKSTSRKSR